MKLEEMEDSRLLKELYFSKKDAAEAYLIVKNIEKEIERRVKVEMSVEK